MRVTIEAVRAALSFLPADLARDDWVRIGMALKAEFPGEEGFELFNEWSATAETYKAKDARSTWKSIKASGGVGIGTLIHEAKAHGYPWILAEGRAKRRMAPKGDYVRAALTRRRSAATDAILGALQMALVPR